MDIGELISNTWDSAKDNLSTQLQMGVSSGLGYLEQQAINTISADKAQHEQNYQAAVSAQLAQPANPNSFGSYLSSITQSPVLKQYGPYLVVGVLVVAGLAIYLKGK